MMEEEEEEEEEITGKQGSDGTRAVCAVLEKE